MNNNCVKVFIDDFKINDNQTAFIKFKVICKHNQERFIIGESVNYDENKLNDEMIDEAFEKCRSRINDWFLSVKDKNPLVGKQYEFKEIKNVEFVENLE